MGRRTKKIDPNQIDILSEQNPDDATTVSYARPPAKKPKKKSKMPDALAKRTKEFVTGWGLGFPEGASFFRRRLLLRLEALDYPLSMQDILADIAEIDDELRRRFPREYDRQLMQRTKDDAQEEKATG